MIGDKLRKLLFFIICLFLFGLAIFKIKPESALWRYPLAPHSCMYHHTIISVLDDLYRDPNFLKGDLVVEAVKKYFLPYKYIQYFFVNKLGVELALFIDIFTILGVLANFIGIALLSLVLSGNRRISVILSLLILVASLTSKDAILLREASINFPRFFAQGVCLISLVYFFKKKYLSSLIICSLGYIFHYGMPFYLSLIYLFYFLMRLKTFSKRELFLYLFVFAILTSLISLELIYRLFYFLNGSGFDFALWKKIIYDTLGPYFSYKYPAKLFINIFFPFCFFYIAIKVLRFKLELAYIFLAYVLTQAIHFFVFDLFFIPNLARALLCNTSYYMPIFMVVIYSAIFSEFYFKPKISRQEILILVFLTLVYFTYLFIPYLRFRFLILSFFALYIITMLAPYYNRSLHIKRRYPLILLFLLVTFCCGFFYIKEVVENKSQPQLYNNWLDVQLWIKNNTNKTDRVIIPFNDDTLHGMRIYGKRSVMSLKPYESHFILLLDPNLTKDAVKEFTSYWNVPKKNDIPLNFSEYNILECPKLFGNNLQKNDLLKLKNNYTNLAYIITDGREIENLELVYKNRDYKIYKIE